MKLIVPPMDLYGGQQVPSVINQRSIGSGFGPTDA